MERRRQRSQALAAMIAFIVWVIFIVAFALAWAPDLELFQNIVIAIASFVAAAAAAGGAGAVVRGGKQVRQAVTAIITLVAWLIFIVLFALFWATDLSLFQNVVILIASLVAAITVGVGIYGIRYGWESSEET